MKRLAAPLVALFYVTSASALTLDFAAPATLTFESFTQSSHQIATGPFADGALPLSTQEGGVFQRVWRVNTGMATALQVLEPLRAQIQAEGYEIALDCDTASCGGYDFRFGIDVVPSPDMFVDLADYRYLSATSPEGVLSLLVSSSGVSTYVQLTVVTDNVDSLPPTATFSTRLPTNSFDPASLAARLDTDGAAVLDDLEFATGTSDLGDAQFPSLEALASYLRVNPERTVALVGHTDAVGALDGNMALSKRRAASVRQRLIDTYGIPAEQVLADGVGFLAPRASNLTDTGRAQNRRVEVVLTSTR